MCKYGGVCLVEVSVYVAGFPCTPYSLLSTTRRMLHDQNAKQLFRVIKRIRRYRPKVSWIENVVVQCCAMHLHVRCSALWFLKTKVGVLENVLGFKPILDKILALIQTNVPGGFGCTWDVFVQ